MKGSVWDPSRTEGTAMYRSKRILSAVLSLLLCLSVLPFGAIASLAAPDGALEMPEFLLMEDRSKYVNEIPTNKNFAVSGWFGDDADIISISLVGADNANEYKLYEEGIVNYGGRIYSEDEGTGYMVDFSPASFEPGAYRVRLVTTYGMFETEETVSVIRSADYVEPPKILTKSLPDGFEGTSYSAKLEAKAAYGGEITWTLDSGRLPEGVSLNAKTGAITGVPKSEGFYYFGVTAAEKGGESRTVYLTITVNGTPKCMVRFELSGGRGASGEKYDARRIEAGSETVLPAAPTRNDSRFIGWRDDGGAVYPPGASVRPEADVTYTAVFSLIKALSVKLPKDFPAAAGSLWLEIRTESGRVETYWYGDYDTPAVPEISVRPVDRVGQTVTAMTLYGYVDGFRTPLASWQGKADDLTNSVQLTATGEKWSVLRGVSVAGLTPGADYMGVSVEKKSGGYVSLGDFPVMTATGAAYTVKITGNPASAAYTAYDWNVSYDCALPADGMITVSPVKYENAAIVSGVVTMDGEPTEWIRISASQSVNGVTRTATGKTDGSGEYELSLLPGVPAELSVTQSWQRPFIKEGARLDAPKNGDKHDVAIALTELSAEIGINADAEPDTLRRYLRANTNGALYLELSGGCGQIETDYHLDRAVDRGGLKFDVIAAYAGPDDGQAVSISYNGGYEKLFAPAAKTVRYKNGKGSVSFSADFYPGVLIPLSAETTGKYVLAWFDAAGKYIGGSSVFSLYDETVDCISVCPAQKAGSYTLVLVPAVLGGDAMLNGATLKSLNKEQNLKTWTVTLGAHQIAELEAADVTGTLSENAAYVTKPHSTLHANAASFSDTKQVIAFTGSIGLDPGLTDGKLLKLRMRQTVRYLSTAILRTVVIGGKEYPFTSSSGVYSVDFSDAPIALPVRYTIYATAADASRDVSVELRADVKFGTGSGHDEYIGRAVVNRPGAHIATLSSYVCSDTVSLNGIAKANERVDIFDSGVKIATATAGKDGSFTAAVPLFGTRKNIATVHELWAVSASGVTSDTLIVTHSTAGPELKSILLYANDSDKPVPSGGMYYVNGSMRDVKLTASFIHPEALQKLAGFDKKVVFKVRYGNGDVAFYDAEEGKNGLFSAEIGFVSGYITAVNVMYAPKNDSSTISAGTDGSLLYAASDTAESEMDDCMKELRNLLSVGSDGKLTFSGKTARDAFDVTFTDGGAAITGSTAGFVSSDGKSEMEKGLAAAAKDLADQGYLMRSIHTGFKTPQNMMQWIDAVAQEKIDAVQNGNDRAAVYTRETVFADKQTFEDTRAAFERFTTDRNWNASADPENHTRQTVGKNKVFDSYMIGGEDDNYLVMISFYADTSKSPAVYTAEATVFLNGAFDGFTGLLDGRNATKTANGLMSLLTVKAYAEKPFKGDKVWFYYGGNFDEKAAYEKECTVESATTYLGGFTAGAGLFCDNYPNASLAVKGAGTFFGIAGIGLTAYNTHVLLKNADYRWVTSAKMIADLNQLFSSPCFKRLTPAQQQMCYDQRAKFDKAFKRAFSTDRWVTATSFGINCGCFVLSVGALIPGAGKAVGYAAAGGSGLSVAHSLRNGGMVSDTRAELVKTYNESYKMIYSIIRGQTRRHKIDDCRDPNNGDGDGGYYKTNFDPAGIVYEGVIENPVPGAEVTLWYAADANGALVTEAEAKNVRSLIPAADIKGLSPARAAQTTDETGAYQWFVPQGLWFVTARYGGLTGSSAADRAATVRINGVKANGETVTNLLPVLPVQLDVNIPLVDKTAPVIESVRFTTEGVYVTYSKYMVDTANGGSSVLNVKNYTLRGVSGPVAVKSASAVVQGHTPENRGAAVTYTKTVLITTEKPLKAGDTLTLTVNRSVQSYAGSTMAANGEEAGKVVSQTALGRPVIEGGADQTLPYGSPVAITLPKNTPAGCEIRYTTDGSEPTAQSALYTNPLGAECAFTVKAIAVCPGYRDSEAAQATIRVEEAQAFTVSGDVLTQDIDPAGLTLTLTGNGFTKNTMVSNEGSYVFYDVPVGAYTLSFAGNDKLAAAKTDIELTTFDRWADIALPSVSAYTPGDVDKSGEITAADARLALRMAVGLEDFAPGSPEFLAADADKSGGVTAADARLILRAAVGLEDPKNW